MDDEIKGRYGNGAIDNCSLDLSIDRTMKSFQSNHNLMIESGQQSHLGGGERRYVDDDDDDDETLNCCCLCLTRMYSSQDTQQKKMKLKRFSHVMMFPYPP
jgi:hypothetical protein